SSKTEKPPSPAPQSSQTHKPATPAAETPQEQKTSGSSFRELQQQGWKITCNLSLPNGDTVDVFLQSPKGNAFIVDVQSQWGEVVYEEGVLKLRQGIGVSNFENDLLGQITEQAMAVKKMKRLRSVTPILCFTEAALSIETVNNKARDVYIVKREFLVRKLLRLEKD
ncbi:MAG TPA: NERD domain-containing protein, partial [Coleofasciculaceae cyanobacterium]